MSDSNSKNNNSYAIKNSQMDMWGCVWFRQSFLNHDNNNSQPSEPFIYWGLKIYRSTFNDISLCKKMQPQNKGPGMLWGWSCIMPMMSCDVMVWLVGGGVTVGGGLSWKIETWQFSMNFSQIPHKCVSKYSMYILPNFQSNLIHENAINYKIM